MISWRRTSTYSGHTSAYAAALANLDIIEREGRDTRARELEGELASGLAPLVEHPLVSEVRTGTGLLAAVQLKPALVDADASLAGRVAKACRDEGGTITCALAGGGLQISPPLVITEEQFAELAAGLRTGLDAVGRTPAGSSQVTSGLGRRGRDRAGREQCDSHVLLRQDLT